MIYYINFYKFGKFHIILMFEMDFTDQFLKTRSGLQITTWRHKHLNLCEKFFCYKGNMQV